MARVLSVTKLMWTAALAILISAAFFVPRSNAASPSPQGCFSQNGVDDSFIPALVRSERIAAVQPIFTATPYSQYKFGSFYAFYAKYANAAGNITTDLGWLSTSVSSGRNYNGGWGAAYGLYAFLSSPAAQACGLVIGTNVHVIDDLNVSAGGLTNPDGSPRFDVAVVPFSEYVTDSEYQNYESFVRAGGTLVLSGAHSIEWFVNYDPNTNIETFAHGHGFAYNGKSAWPLPCLDRNFTACPWWNGFAAWFGSIPVGSTGIQYVGAKVNSTHPLGKPLAREFGDVVFSSYRPHEENGVANVTGTSIIANFGNFSGRPIASYTHDFGRGRVVCMCVSGDDIIATDQSAQYFLLLGIISPLLSPQFACSAAANSSSSALTCTAKVNGWSPTGTVSWISSSSLHTPLFSCKLVNGSCSVSVTSPNFGSSSVTVAYSGDSRNAASMGSSYTVPAHVPKSSSSSSSSSSTVLSSTVSVASSLPASTSATTTGGAPEAGNTLQLVAASALVVVLASLGVAFALRRRPRG